MYDIEILPGILEKEWSGIEKKIELVRPFAKALHIDILDGKFADNVSFLDPKPFEKYSKDFILELHLMVEEPINYLDAWSKAGFQRFLGHIEKMSNQGEFVAKAQSLGEVGLVVDGKTSLEKITVPFVDLDSILLMSINAGFSGQSFQPEVLQKIQSLREKTEIHIEIDGGITDGTIIDAYKAGANRFVTTSFLFKSPNPQEQYQKLHSCLQNI